MTLLLNPWAWATLGLLLVGAYFAGDFTGFHAHWYADCQAATAQRNAAISAVNHDEAMRHAQEEERRAHAAKAFANCPNIQSCILTRETAACLDLLME